MKRIGFLAPVVMVLCILALVAGCGPSGVDDPITGPEPPTGPGYLSAYSNHDPATVKVLRVVEGRVSIVRTLTTPFSGIELPLGSYGLLCERTGFTLDRTYSVKIASGDTALVPFDLKPIEGPPVQATAEISANKTQISSGEAVTLTTKTGNGIWAEVSPYGAVLPNGIQEITVYPTVTTTYALNVLGRGENNFAHAEVTVVVFDTPTPPPTGKLTLEPTTVIEGQSTSITVEAANFTVWDVSGAGITQAGTEGNFNFRDTPTHSGWVTLKVTGTGGRVFVTRVFLSVVPQGATKPTLTVASVPDSASITIFRQSGNSWTVLTSFSGVQTISVDPGIYKVTGERSGWRMATEFALVEPGENELLVLHLDRPGDSLPPPRLLIESEPSGAQADVWRLSTLGKWELLTTVTTPTRIERAGDFKVIFNSPGFHTGFAVASVPEHGTDVAFAQLAPLGDPAPPAPTVTVTVPGPLSNRRVEYGRGGPQTFTFEVNASANARLVLLFVNGGLVRSWNAGGVYQYEWTPPNVPNRDGNPTVDGAIYEAVAVAIGSGGESSDFTNVLAVYADELNWLTNGDAGWMVGSGPDVPVIQGYDPGSIEASATHGWTLERRTDAFEEGVAVGLEIDSNVRYLSQGDDCPATSDLLGVRDKILWFDAGTIDSGHKYDVKFSRPACSQGNAMTQVMALSLAGLIR